MAKTDLGKFSFVFSDISFVNKKVQIDVLGWPRIKKSNLQNVSKIQFYCLKLLRQTHYVHFAYFKKSHRALLYVVVTCCRQKLVWFKEMYGLN